MPETGARTDPFLGFRFLVRLDGDPMGGFSEVTGLQAEVEITDVKEGGLNRFVHRLPGRATHSNLSLRRGLVGIAIWEWFNAIVAGDISRKTVVVELMTPAGDKAAARWVFDGAFPSKWNGPDLKADQSAVAIETVEICHHGFRMEVG